VHGTAALIPHVLPDRANCRGVGDSGKNAREGEETQEFLSLPGVGEANDLEVRCGS
jgi:hypothetical protein